MNAQRGSETSTNILKKKKREGEMQKKKEIFLIADVESLPIRWAKKI